MLRKIIEIDEEKCNGCGACASACHEGAIGMVNGKAKLHARRLLRRPRRLSPRPARTNAITFVEREAAAYDEGAVESRTGPRKRRTSCPAAAPERSPAPYGCDADDACAAAPAEQTSRLFPDSGPCS
jgi:Fe-S-cluster-containing hydrogenase component 2